MPARRARTVPVGPVVTKVSRSIGPPPIYCAFAAATHRHIHSCQRITYNTKLTKLCLLRSKGPNNPNENVCITPTTLIGIAASCALDLPPKHTRTRTRTHTTHIHTHTRTVSGSNRPTRIVASCGLNLPPSASHPWYLVVDGQQGHV